MLRPKATKPARPKKPKREMAQALLQREVQRSAALQSRLDATARELSKAREQLAQERESDFYEDGAGVRHFRFAPGKDAASLAAAEKQAQGLTLALGHFVAMGMKDHIWAVRRFVEMIPAGGDRDWLLASLDALEARLATALTVQRVIG